MDRTKAIIFDIGGVLQVSALGVGRGSAIHQMIARKLGISIDQYFDSIDTVYAKSIVGGVSEEKAVSIMAKNLKTTPKKLKKLFIRVYKKQLNFNKELFKYALKKKKQGYKISILSDQWWLSKTALITKKFYRHFNPIIVSTDVKVRKPNPKIYQITLKRMGLSAKQTVFIDNQKWNLPPAKKLGMKTVLFKNNKQAIREIEKLLK